MKTIKNLAILAVAALAAAACSHDKNLITPTDHFPADGVIRVATDVTRPQTPCRDGNRQPYDVPTSRKEPRK